MDVPHIKVCLNNMEMIYLSNKIELIMSLQGWDRGPLLFLFMRYLREVDQAIKFMVLYFLIFQIYLGYCDHPYR